MRGGVKGRVLWDATSRGLCDESDHHALMNVVVYYCRTYVKAVRGGGGEEKGRVLWDATAACV